MTRPAGVVDVVRAEEPRRFVRDVIRLVRHPTRGDEERESIRTRRPDSSSRKLQRVLPGNPPEAAISVVADHRVRETAEFSKLLRGLRPQWVDVREAPDAEGPHRVQRKQVEADRAKMDPFHREIAEARGSQGTAVADAIMENAPCEERPALVVPGRPEDFSVIVGLHGTQSERDRAHAPDA